MKTGRKVMVPLIHTDHSVPQLDPATKTGSKCRRRPRCALWRSSLNGTRP